MEITDHPDLFGEAVNQGMQRAIQMASAAVAAGQMYLYQQRNQAHLAAERDERATRALNAQARADRDTARAGWAPALDPAWLRQATIPDTARTWGAAMPYADRAVPWYEPLAATALRKSEDRLRDLHPHAMARYDRLRADGLSAADAMREAAPLFARPTRVYDGPSVPRPELASASAASASTALVPRKRSWERDFPLPIQDALAATSDPAAPFSGPVASSVAQQTAASRIPDVTAR